MWFQYVEIKAPQAALMEPDENQNRYRPTKELYKAENQLIHYWYQARGDSLFKQRFQLHNESQVKLGGVVIGRNDTITRNSDPSKVRAARLSLDIRMNTLYQHNGLKVLVWDRLLTFVAPRSSPAAGRRLRSPPLKSRHRP